MKQIHRPKQLPEKMYDIILLTLVKTAPKAYSREAHTLFLDSPTTQKSSTAIDIFIGGIAYRTNKAWIRTITFLLTTIKQKNKPHDTTKAEAMLHVP